MRKFDFKNPYKRFFAILSLVFLALGVILLLTFKNSHTSENIAFKEANPHNSANYSGSGRKRDSRTAEEKAIATLEQPDDKLEGDEAEKVSNAIQAMVDWIDKNPKDEVIPFWKAHDTLISTETLQQLKGYMEDGFTYDKSRTTYYKSNNGNVYQFVMILKNGDSEVAVTGNYGVDGDQVQLANFEEG